MLLCFADMASLVAYVFTLAWCAFFFVAGTYYWKRAYDGSQSYDCGGAQTSIISEFAYFLYTVAQYWVVWVIAMLCIDFNPFPSSPRRFYYLNKLLACVTVSQVGRWYIEREKIFKVIRKNVAERGIDKFHLPSEKKKRLRHQGSSKNVKSSKGRSKSAATSHATRGRSNTRGNSSPRGKTSSPSRKQGTSTPRSRSKSPSRLNGEQPLGSSLG